MVQRQIPASPLAVAIFDQARQPLVVAGGGLSRGLAVWNVAAGEELFGERNIGTALSCLTFSPDGKTLATGSDDNILRFWSARDGKLLAHVKLPASPSQVNAGADGMTWIAGGDSKWWQVAPGGAHAGRCGRHQTARGQAARRALRPNRSGDRPRLKAVVRCHGSPARLTRVRLLPMAMSWT